MRVKEATTQVCLNLKCVLPIHRCDPVGYNVDEVFPEEAHCEGIHAAMMKAFRERLAFDMAAYSLKFEEVFRVGENDTELMRIWGNASMGIIQCRYAITRLVSALASDPFRHAIIIASLFKARRGLQVKDDDC
jgi:hypothetical protein